MGTRSFTFSVEFRLLLKGVKILNLIQLLQGILMLRYKVNKANESRLHLHACIFFAEEKRRLNIKQNTLIF